MPPIITTSSRRAFRRCPQRWVWSYVDGLQPKETNDKLWFGIGMHVAWAHWYGPGLKRRRDWIEKFEEFCDSDEVSRRLRTTGVDGEKSWIDGKALGIGILKHYRKRYGLDKTWDVIHVEEPFSIEIPHPDRPEKTVALFNSTFDGVIRDADDGLVKLLEHKTAAQIRTQHLPNDDQAGSYWPVATHVLRDKGILGKRERIAGIAYNIARKALPPTDRPRDAAGYYLNKDGSVSKNQPAPFFHREFIERGRVEQATQIYRMGHEVQHQSAVRRGRLPVYKNYTMDCFWDCEFFTMCGLHDQGAEWREFRDALFVVRDPFERYRHLKSTEG